jgi:hypothetical protein
LGVKGGRRVGLTTLPPPVRRMSENVGASTSRNPKGLHGLYRDNFTFIIIIIIIILSLMQMKVDIEDWGTYNTYIYSEYV